jgi:hypothetical protein
MKKISADSIANEMFSLLKKNASWQKKANEESVVMKDHTEDNSVEDDSADYSDDSEDLEDNLEDFLMADDGAEENDASYVDDEIDNMESMSNNAEDSLMRGVEGSHNMSANDGADLMGSSSDRHLMQGLGKIEASLRRKGEGFAADLVRTTALSIREDIVKEASQKTYVLRSLIKMASNLDRSGNRKAASLVKATITKINR